MESIQGMTKAARVARRERWAALMAEQQAGGLSAAAFCRERGIATWQFSYWRKALATSENSTATNGFVELRPASRASGVWVEAGRWRVNVETGFNADVLRRTMEALAGS
jgi:hypothetical protein